MRKLMDDSVGNSWGISGGERVGYGCVDFGCGDGFSSSFVGFSRCGDRGSFGGFGGFGSFGGFGGFGGVCGGGGVGYGCVDSDGSGGFTSRESGRGFGGVCDCGGADSGRSVG